MPQHEQTGCTVSFTRYQSTNVCRAFSIFRVVVLISASKVGVTKNTYGIWRKWTPRYKYFKYQNFPAHFRLSLFLECFGEILTKIDQIYIPYKFAPSVWIRFKLIKVCKQHTPREEIISPSETTNQWDNGTSWRQYLGCF